MRIVLILTAILVLSGTALYMTASRYDGRQDTLANLEAEIAYQNEQAAILNAEWSYLSRPERVITLSSDLLSLQPISTDRVLPLDAIPFRQDAFADKQDSNVRGEAR